MRNLKFTPALICACMCIFVSTLQGQTVTLGTWLQEGTGTVTGTGDSFSATPTAAGIFDNGENFPERNAARHRVYQTFDAVDFSEDGQQIMVTFDVTFGGAPRALDSGFRMSLVDTSTNQGFFPVAWDVTTTAGSFNRVRFVDNLDGATGDAHAGGFTDAINGSGTIASGSGAPTVTNDATAQGLVAGNTVSFEVVFTRDAGDVFSFTTNATEAAGDVVYNETAGSYDPVNPSEPGDTDVANIAVNSFDGIVFGLFEDDPFPSGGRYTVSNIMIMEASGEVLLGDVNQDGMISFLDISPFITLLLSGGFQQEADIDRCGKVDFLDISPFIQILIGT